MERSGEWRSGVEDWRVEWRSGVDGTLTCFAARSQISLFTLIFPLDPSFPWFPSSSSSSPSNKPFAIVPLGLPLRPLRPVLYCLICSEISLLNTFCEKEWKAVELADETALEPSHRALPVFQRSTSVPLVPTDCAHLMKVSHVKETLL